MNFLECPIFKASGKCAGDEIEECRKCSFKQCLEDMVSDLADDIIKETAEFIKRERKAMEAKDGKTLG